MIIVIALGCATTENYCTKRNEVWDDCFNSCEGTCKNKSIACPSPCGPGGCKCRYGHVRNHENECISTFACPINRECGDKEEFHVCFNGCEGTCNDKFKTCPEICGPGGCRCRYGHVRDKENKCISSFACPYDADCPTNEEFDVCFNGCEPSCQNTNPTCPDWCGAYRCKCANGFIRDEVSKKCIKESDCPKK